MGWSSKYRQQKFPEISGTDLRSTAKAKSSTMPDICGGWWDDLCWFLQQKAKTLKQPTKNRSKNYSKIGNLGLHRVPNLGMFFHDEKKQWVPVKKWCQQKWKVKTRSLHLLKAFFTTKTTKLHTNRGKSYRNCRQFKRKQFGDFFLALD